MRKKNKLNDANCVKAKDHITNTDVENAAKTLQQLGGKPWTAYMAELKAVQEYPAKFYCKYTHLRLALFDALDEIEYRRNRH